MTGTRETASPSASASTVSSLAASPAAIVVLVVVIGWRKEEEDKYGTVKRSPFPNKWGYFRKRK